MKTQTDQVRALKRELKNAQQRQKEQEDITLLYIRRLQVIEKRLSLLETEVRHALQASYCEVPLFDRLRELVKSPR